MRRSPPESEALDLHVLGAPPAFVLSQDQTLSFIPAPTGTQKTVKPQTHPTSRPEDQNTKPIHSRPTRRCHSHDGPNRRLHIPSTTNQRWERTFVAGPKPPCRRDEPSLPPNLPARRRRTGVYPRPAAAATPYFAIERSFPRPHPGRTRCGRGRGLTPRLRAGSPAPDSGSTTARWGPCGVA